MDSAATVLLVDDDENDCMLFERAVKKNNFPFRIQVAHNGKEAMDYISGAGEFADRQRFPIPKFIVTDNRMPVMSGTEFLRWLKKHPSLGVVPTIVLGGAATPAEIDTAYAELGIHSYIPKPGNHDELQQIVKLIFEYWAVCVLPRHK